MKEPFSYFAPDVEIEGKIVSEGPVRFDGICWGTIEGKARVIIGTSAQIYGEIQAQSMIINGIIEGDLTSSQSIAILSQGKIVGEITAPPGGISISKGGNFQGALRSHSTSELPKLEDLRTSQQSMNPTENTNSSADTSPQHQDSKDISEKK